MEQELLRRAGEGTLGHAYLVTGRWEHRVEEYAKELAAAMVCTAPAGAEKPCRMCRGCKKALEDIHPDVIHLAPEEGKEFTVDQARALRADAYVTPNEAGRKVYILHKAHRMNGNAQNALLKVLEEGPPYAVFLLLTDNPDALLTTVRSRCGTVTVTGTGEEPEERVRETARELCALLLGEDRWALLHKCVPLEKGNREDTAALWEALRTELIEQPDGKKRARAVKLAQGLGDLLAQTKLNVNQGALWGKLYALADE